MAAGESQWIDKIFNVSAAGFDELALEIFRYQYQQNPVYRKFVDALRVNPENVVSLSHIPFLPIRFFKTEDVKVAGDHELLFTSSGTTGLSTSRHMVRSGRLYEESFLRTFHVFYGAVSDWCVIGLLPSYLERSGSSLVYMVDRLVRESGDHRSGFYLNATDRLPALLEELEREGKKTLLIGVSFALLDMAETVDLHLHHTVIMETGGMKGRRTELVREELHSILCGAFHVPVIHSEYGMTELLSQAYSQGEGLFQCPSWMRIVARDEEDPLELRIDPQRTVTGALNVIDLANVYSCSFIATDDACRVHADGRFEVIGRLDNSDLRGCSLLVL